MDISLVLTYFYPDLAGWEVVNNEITKFPDGVPMPTEAELKKAWKEVQRERAEREVEQKRKARYEQETDHLLYEALTKLNLPELTEWKQAREAIKKEIPYESEEKK